MIIVGSLSNHDNDADAKVYLCVRECVIYELLLFVFPPK